MHEQILALIEDLIADMKLHGDEHYVVRVERIKQQVESLQYDHDVAVSELNYIREQYAGVVPPPADEKDDDFWLEMYEDYHSDED